MRPIFVPAMGMQISVIHSCHEQQKHETSNRQWIHHEKHTRQAKDSGFITKKSISIFIAKRRNKHKKRFNNQEESE